MKETLRTQLRSMKNDKLRIIELYYRVLNEIQKLHTNGIIIHALSPESIIIDESDSIAIEISKRRRINSYTAPELYEINKKISFSCDFYSAGMILYEMLTGLNYWEFKNFSSDSFIAYVSNENVVIKDYELESCKPFSSFISKATAIKPEERFSSIYEMLSDFKSRYEEIGVSISHIEEINRDENQRVETELVVEIGKTPPEEASEFFDVKEDGGEIAGVGREIAIDLGTTNSKVAYFENGKTKILKFNNDYLIPSAIFFESPEKIYFGSKALSMGIQHPECLARLFKRKLKNKNDKITVEFLEQRSPGDEKTALKYYIIDTNIFINEPNIISRFSKDDKIVVSFTVLEEINYLSKNPNTSYLADEAIKSINLNKENLLFEESDESLLPRDFFKSAKITNDYNDNKVLSIAIKLKQNNPLLLTNDRALQIKAQALSIKYKSLKDFLLEKPIEQAKKTQKLEISGEAASALFLRHLKSLSEKALGKVGRAVITVPANFNVIEIEATKRAAEKAGFSEVETLKEPTAAAIAYGFNNENNKKILVYDFGGGTFDVSIIESKGDSSFDVLKTGGDSSLGGEDLTNNLIRHIYDTLMDEYDLDMHSPEDSGLTKSEYLRNKTTIHNEAERVKIYLSDFETDAVGLPNIYLRKGELKSLKIPILRKDFEDIVRDHINKTTRVLDKTLNETQLHAEDIDIVVLAGGTSQIPLIKDKVRKYFGRLPNSERNPATVIAEGGAIYASSRWGCGIQRRIVIHDKTIDDFGVSITIGDKIKDRLFDCLIPLGTPLPAMVKRQYMPERDFQERLEIQIYTRESGHENINRIVDTGIEPLERIIIENIPPRERDELEVSVKFELSKEYLLEVEATLIDKGGKELAKKGITVRKESQL